MTELLNTEEFTKIIEDPTKKHTREVNNTINNIHLIMTKLEKQSIKPNNPIIPKIHKQGKKMRPIVRNIGAPTHNIAKWLVKRFETFPKFLTLNIKKINGTYKKT